MSRAIRARLALFVAILAGTAFMATLYAEDKPQAGKVRADERLAPNSTSSASTVKPKPLSGNVDRGLAYLVSQQDASGGWGQGGGWRTGGQGGRVEGTDVADPPDVGNTCIATLALLRAGNTPKQGKYAKNVARAVDFICKHVEESDKSSLYVTTVRDTQLQSKIGPYVDTFLASLVLAEIKGKMPDSGGEKRLVASLDKSIGKIQKHQKEDGSFDGNTGWAPVFSQGLASKALNRARQSGATVNEEALARAENNALGSVDVASGSFKSAGAGGGVGGGGGALFGARAKPATISPDAGVLLYNASNQTAALQEAANTNKAQERMAREILARKDAPKPEKDKAQATLDRVAKVEEAREAAVKAVVGQLQDRRFIQGFGSNGGEEFLSYLNIGETLVAKGGEEWSKWDRSMTDNLNRIQNKDGSWSGDHCITGRTFCTASALLVLMADRTPIPIAAKIRTR
jgi:hypothetical protein